MREQQLEAWVLDVVDRVVGNQALEDSRVELKSEWPTNYRRAARQLGGLANAARGDFVLWVIGVDEKTRSVVAASHVEMSAWWSKVARCFDEISPAVTHLAVPTPHGLVHGLLLDTSQAPYIVSTSGGATEREVPWREGNKTRSARRSELLRTVIAESSVPGIDVIDGAVTFNRRSNNAGQIAPDAPVILEASVAVYLAASGECTLPAHRWQLSLAVGTMNIDLSREVDFAGPRAAVPGTGTRNGFFHLNREYAPVGAIQMVPGSGLHVAGSDRVEMSIRYLELDPEIVQVLRNVRRAVLRVDLPLGLSSRSIKFSVPMRRVAGKARAADGSGDWRIEFETSHDPSNRFPSGFRFEAATI